MEIDIDNLIYSLDIIKSKIQMLYRTNPHIHINGTLASPKIKLKNEPVVVKDVYPYIFRIEERQGGTPRTHTIQYTDVLLHHIDILELEEK